MSLNPAEDGWGRWVGGYVHVTVDMHIQLMLGAWKEMWTYTSFIHVSTLTAHACTHHMHTSHACTHSHTHLMFLQKDCSTESFTDKDMESGGVIRVKSSWVSSPLSSSSESNR